MAEQQPPAPNIKNRKQQPQKNIDDFWASYTSKFPGKVTTILPQNQHAVQKSKQKPTGPVQSEPVKAGYERARRECYATVDKISKECRRVNRRYRDIHFDMEFDLKMGQQDCLETLVGPLGGQPFNPKSVKRVGEIFEEPKFYVDGATPTDIRQGFDGDCWFLSGLSACVHRPDWIDSVCVHKDEAVGVYGFVFYRDGAWIHTVVDDRLYLTAADWDESVHEKWAVSQLNNNGNEQEYKRIFQTGSKALYFAQCSSENETWLPLIEKAYAKAHGDYRSIEGGFTGEGIEDLTGGVTTELWTSDILDRDVFWKELLQVNQEFLFSCATGWSDNFLGGSYMTDRKGVVSLHAYSIMEAKEVEGVRLLKLRNPWGKSEWKGPWSDGSAEWTPEWMTRLNHKFGDDGVFWMSYKDLLTKFGNFDRTRLFNSPEWRVSQQWTSVDVPWSAEYNSTKFEIEVKQAGRCIIVLSQLDDRYFKGLEGQYQFDLQFRIENNDEEGYIVRSNETYFMNRSCNVELELDPGTYTVLIKIDAARYENDKSPEHVIRETFKTKRNKLLAIGLAYDLAHAKAIPYETDEEKAAKKAKQKAEKIQAKAEAKKAKRDEKWLEWEKKMRLFMRAQREKERQKRHKEKKAADKKSKREAEKSEQGEQQSAEAHGAKQAPNEAVESTAQADSAKRETTKESPKEDDGAGKTGPTKSDEPTSKQETDKPTDSMTAEQRQETAEWAQTSTPTHSDNSSGIFTDAEAKIKDLMEQAQAIMSQAKAAANSGVTNSTPKSADAPPPVDTTRREPDAESETVATPTTSASMSTVKASPEQAEKPEAPAPPAAPEPPAIAETLQVPTLEVPQDSASSSSDDVSSVISWATSIDSKLDYIDYSSSEEDGEEEASDDTGDEDEDNQPIADDPWNAVCVVGLRVFSKSEVAVKIIKPKTDKERDEKAGEAPLDVDDISKAHAGDKSVASQAELAKPSVDGERPPLVERDSFQRTTTSNARRVH